MEIALTSSVPVSAGSSGSGVGGRGHAFSSSNGLALLASITLKKALKVEGSDNQLEQELLQYTDIAKNAPLTTYQHQKHHHHQQQQQQHQLQSLSQQQAVPNSLLSKVLSMDTQMISGSAANATATASSSATVAAAAATATTTTINGTKTILTTSSTSTKSSATSLTIKGTSLTTNTATNATVQTAAPAPTTTTTTNTNKHNFKIPSDILDDLASRFIINVPDMELSNLIRICFQVELAYWFYLDFFCASDEEKKLQPCGIKQFAMQLFQHIPFLREHLSKIDKVLEDWKNYKMSVPTFGAILISEDLNYCLLVQSYFAKSSWGFPKGKVNENEDPEHCAAREVYEETGYDITELIVPNDFIEAVINYQYTRLYIVRNVSLNTQFSPRTRNEIKCCDWFPIDSLPINKNDAISKAKLGINANSFFMIMPFVKRLKKWVNDKRNANDATALIAAANAAATSINGGGNMPSRRKHSNSQSQQSTNAQTINNNNNNNSNKNQSTIATSTSPKSNSPLTTNTTTITGSAGGNNQKYTNNNSNNNNNNNKKNKQQKHNYNNNNNDDNNALNGNANNATANNNCSNSSSNRSKRQRHKSMGDLDGVKLNNLNQQQQQQQSNGKNPNNFATITATTTATTSSSMVNCNSNNKRNATKIIAAGSNGNGNSNSNNNNNNNNSIGTTTKRQLFHSQSQHVIVQQPQGEKIVSSFDLIRKEKQQQLKAAKAQKQQQQIQQQQQQQQQLQLQQINNQNGGDGNSNVSGRVRAKSQGDKVCITNQQQSLQQQQQLNKNLNNNKQQRVQKQQQPQQTSIIQNAMHKTDENATPNTIALTSSSVQAGQCTAAAAQTLPSITGADLLAIAAAASASNQTAINAAAFNVVERRQQTQSQSQQEQQHQLKPRPASVALHYTIATPTAATLGVQRMASGTELRILKRSNSHQHPQQLRQQQQQYQPLKFTPSFNSWTNFSFTKNFITNVFC